MPVQVPIASVQLLEQVASGEDACIHRALYSSELGLAKVACKRHVIRSSQSVSRFESELALFPDRPLARLVLPLACVRSAPHFWQLLPWASLGDVRTFSALPRHLAPGVVLSLAADMADALAQLHDEARVAHRDVKSANFLVFFNPEAAQHRLQARLADFGSAVSLDATSPDVDSSAPSRGFHKKRMRGTTTLFASPEVLTTSTGATVASDVYSLGIALCELATGLPPYSRTFKDSPALNTVVDATYSEQALCQAICYSDLRPLDSADAQSALHERLGGKECAEQFAMILQRCWASDPSKRPTAAAVADMVRDLARSRGVELPCTYEMSPAAAAATPPPTTGSPASVHLALRADGAARLKPPAARRIPNQLLKTPAPLSIGSFATSGRRGADKMEDRHSVSYSTLPDQTQATVVVLLDGHGGQAAAEFANADLAPRLHEACAAAGSREDLFARVEEAFCACDRALEQVGAQGSGTTALALIVRTKLGRVQSIVTANAGDCRAVAGKCHQDAVRAVRMTTDHHASDAEERQRVELAGGKVELDAQGNARVQGLLQVTRSLGDFAVKPFGVLARPELRELACDADLQFLVLATDGLYDVMGDQQVCQAVLDTAKDAGLAAKRLGSDAVAKGSTDNVSVVCVFLKDWA